MCFSIPSPRTLCLYIFLSSAFIASGKWCIASPTPSATLRSADDTILSADSSLALPVTQQAGRAWDFINSVGVVTHFGYTDTNYYQQAATIISDIQALHIRHIRDGIAYEAIPPNLYSIFGQLSQADIHANLIVPSPVNGQGVSASDIESVLPNYPSVESIEGPNEFDLAGDSNWVSDLRNFLPTVSQIGKDTGLPVVGPALTQPASYPAIGNISAWMNYGNMHVYQGGRNPETVGWGPYDAENNSYGSLLYNMDEVGVDSPGLPIYMTETGYIVSSTPATNDIPESVEAVYEPRLLLNAWNTGVKRSYIYELMDDPSSTPGFGLLHSDMSPRAAYTAIKTLMGLLADSNSSFNPGSLTYTLSGNTTGVETTLLQKQDGSFWLAAWLSGSIYDVNALVATPIPPQSVTITLNGANKVTNVWSFDDTGNAAQTSPNASSLDLSVKSTVTLLEIGKSSPGAPANLKTSVVTVKSTGE